MPNLIFKVQLKSHLFILFPLINHSVFINILHIVAMFVMHGSSYINGTLKASVRVSRLEGATCLHVFSGCCQHAVCSVQY